MRRARKTDLIVEVKRGGRPKAKDQAQSELHFIDENEPAKSWEYAVLVCNTNYELENIGQLYRDRADCENGFDEIKNQWGWGGYSTHDIERCALSARSVRGPWRWFTTGGVGTCGWRIPRPDWRPLQAAPSCSVRWDA